MFSSRAPLCREGLRASGSTPPARHRRRQRGAMWGATPAGAAAERPRRVVARRGRPQVKRRLRRGPRPNADRRPVAAAPRAGGERRARRPHHPERPRTPWRAPRAWPRFARTRPELELGRRSSPPQAPPRSRAERRRAQRTRPRRRIGPFRPPYTSHQPA